MTVPVDESGSPAREPAAAMVFSCALLELTVRENGHAMNTISRVFTEVTRLFADLEQRCDRMCRAATDDAELAAVRRDCAAASASLRGGLQAIQLHDITDQRLSHVAAILGALLEGREPDIASVLSDDEERALLRLIEQGVSGADVIRRLEVSQVRGSVELF